MTVSITVRKKSADLFNCSLACRMVSISLESENNAVDLIVLGPIRQNAQATLVACKIPKLPLYRQQSIEHSRNQRREVGHVDVQTNVGNLTIDIGWNDFE